MDDKKRILKMVEEGKLTSEDAIKLLEALETTSNERVYQEKPKVDEDFFKITPNPKGEKMLYVRVLSGDGAKVRVNIPLEFIKIMGGIGKMHVGELEKHNIDMDRLMEAIENGFVGRIVEVEDGDDRVIVEIG